MNCLTLLPAYDGSVVAGYHVEYAHAAAESMAVRNTRVTPLLGLGGAVVRHIRAEQVDFEDQRKLCSCLVSVLRDLIHRD